MKKTTPPPSPKNQRMTLSAGLIPIPILSTSNLINNAPFSPPPSSIPHTFMKKHSNTPLKCDACDSFIWGLIGKLGFECTTCGFVCHSKCLSTSTVCSGPSNNSMSLRASTTDKKFVEKNNYVKENDDLQQIFSELIAEKETLVMVYYCAIKTKSIKPKIGQLYITDKHIFWKSRKSSKKIAIVLEDVVNVTLRPLAATTKEIFIKTPTEEYIFIPLFHQVECNDVILFVMSISQEQAILEAAIIGDVETVKRIVEKFRERAPNSFKSSPFTERIEKKVAYSAVDVMGRETALHFAVRNNSSTMVDLILQYYSQTCNIEEVNVQDNQGYTALHVAVTQGLSAQDESSIVMSLLKFQNIKVNIRNHDGNIPLHYFCKRYSGLDCKKVGNIFIDMGADVNCQNLTGETPLHYAIFNNSVRLILVTMLLERGANPDITNTYGETPLHYAVRLGRPDLVWALLKGGADPTIRSTKDDKTPYILALQKGDAEIAEILKQGLDVVLWLQGAGLAQYKKSFLQEEMDHEDVLHRITNDLLENTLGVKDPAHRTILLDCPKPPALLRSLSENGDRIEGDRTGTISGSFLGARAHKLKRSLAALSHTQLTGETWVIRSSDLEYCNKLGTGSSGKVYRGLYLGHEVAIKVLKSNEEKDVSEFMKEFQIMGTVRSDNLVCFFGACLEPQLAMVMELCRRGSLYHILNGKEYDIGWDAFFKFTTDAIKGVRSLHNKEPQIVHRDLKSLNLLVTDKWEIKLADFGLSRFTTSANLNTLSKTRGTFAYCAPEVFEGKQAFSTKSDIYAFGIILWETLYRVIYGKYQRPFSEFEDISMDIQIVVLASKKNLRPTIPHCHIDLIQLIERCWGKDVTDRPSCDEVYSILLKLNDDFSKDPQKWDNYRKIETIQSI